MRSLVVVFAAVLVGSLAACAVAQDDSGSSSEDFSHGRPGTGRRPVGPIIAADDEPDAAPPATSGALAADVADGGAPSVPVGSDTEAPPADPGGSGASDSSGEPGSSSDEPASDDGGSPIAQDPDAG